MDTTIQNATPEQLRAALAKAEAQEKADRLKEKQQYEQARDEDVKAAVISAITLNQQLTVFKTKIAEMMDHRLQELLKYGSLRANSKGGFTVTTTDGTMRVVQNRKTQPVWDERSAKALTLIQSFLEDTVKKKDLKLFEILISFLARDKKGDLEYDKVMQLYQHRDKYDDVRWVEGLDLILESYRLDQTGFSYDIFMKDDQNKWQRIDLTFASIPVNSQKTEENATV